MWPGVPRLVAWQESYQRCIRACGSHVHATRRAPGHLGQLATPAISTRGPPPSDAGSRRRHPSPRLPNALCGPQYRASSPGRRNRFVAPKWCSHPKAGVTARSRRSRAVRPDRAHARRLEGHADEQLNLLQIDAWTPDAFDEALAWRARAGRARFPARQRARLRPATASPCSGRPARARRPGALRAGLRPRRRAGPQIVVAAFTRRARALLQATPSSAAWAFAANICAIRTRPVAAHAIRTRPVDLADRDPAYSYLDGQQAARRPAKRRSIPHEDP
jgi:hypothetical protein